MKKFVSYNSSAGSGKTYTLVKEYLKIALATDNENAFKHILAVTFTNKAASEMKERVITALQELSALVPLANTSKYLLADLILPKANGGLGVGNQIIKNRSKKVLSTILHHYNDFGISTIDKFTHKIIRTFAHDLHLPLNFEIELDDAEILSKSIDVLISKVGAAKDLTNLLVEYTTKRAEDEKSWHIEKELFTFSKNLFKDDGDLYLEQIKHLKITDFNRIKKQLYAQTKVFEDEVETMGNEALQLIKDKGIEHKSFSSGYFATYWINLANLKKYEPTASLINIVNGEKSWYAQKTDEHQKQLIDANKDNFIRLFNSSRTYINEHLGNFIVNKLLIKNLYNLALINEIKKTIDELKKENNVLNISDFNKQISKIVANEPIPFIYERVGEKYHHFLIDEFQDTSIIQWHNLIPLIDNALSTENFNMVVGDAKQAIYRFRGGEVEQIINLPKIINSENNSLLKERENTLSRNHKEEILANNFRSKAEIVQFNNQFFQSVASNLSDEYIKIYKNLSQKFDAQNNGGGVSIKFFELADKEVFAEQNFNEILQIIHSCIKDNYQLSDIAILTRNNADGAEVAAFLMENGINVISPDSLLLNNAEEVQCITNLLAHLTSIQNREYQLKILNYFINNVFVEDTIFDVFNQYPQATLNNYLKEKKLAINYKKLANYSLYEITEYFINHFNLDKNVNIYLQFFLDKVYEYSTKKDNSIVNFLTWWEEKSAKFSIVIPAGIDAVNVMSIHKSKGLEFPVVINPFAVSKVNLNEKFFWINKTNIPNLKTAILPILTEIKETKYAYVYQNELNKSVLDLINIMYVAFTRPKDRLYIISQIKLKAGKIVKNKNGIVGDYLFDFCQNEIGHKTADNCYIFGDFNKNSNRNTTSINNKKFSTVNYNNWRDKISVSYEAPKVWEVENPQNIGEYGMLIHEILAEIEQINDVDEVLKRFLLQGVITEEELQTIKTKINQLLSIEKVNYFFTNFDEIKNEDPILTTNGESFQPDRVVIKDGKTIIIDYKTGEQKTSHIKQLENYRLLLLAMGYKNILCYLLYINTRELVEI